MAICANKVEGIRAGACNDVYAAERLMKSNNGQVLCLGVRITGVETARARYAIIGPLLYLQLPDFICKNRGRL
jgi:ribose 5-phosphate isomerase RpiB